MIKKGHFLIKQMNMCSTAGYSSHVNAFKRDIKKEGKKNKKSFVKKYIFMKKLFVKCMKLLCTFSMQCKIKKANSFCNEYCVFLQFWWWSQAFCKDKPKSTDQRYRHVLKHYSNNPSDPSLKLSVSIVLLTTWLIRILQLNIAVYPLLKCHTCCLQSHLCCYATTWLTPSITIWCIECRSSKLQKSL